MRLPSNVQVRGCVLVIFRRSHPRKYSVFHGEISSAIPSFAYMVAPNRRHQEAQATKNSSLIAVLRYSKAHRLLSIGKMAHGFVLRSGFEFDVYVSNNLLGCCLSSGAIAYARQMFVRMPARDSVSWNTMISGFVGLGLCSDGFAFFREMIRERTLPTRPSLISVLVASAEMRYASCTQQIHVSIVKLGFSCDPFVGNSLLKGYVHFGEVEDWWKLLNGMQAFDEISVEIFLRGCASCGIFDSAVELFRYSSSFGLNVSPYSITSLASLCSSHRHADFGVQVHGFAQKAGIDMDVSVVNSLITMYSRSYRLHDAEVLFECSSSKDIVTWNSLINGYAYNGEGDVGLGLFWRLLSSGIVMNESTLLGFLSCCATITVLKSAKKAHALMLKLGEGFEEWSHNAIFAMYCRTKSVENAAAFFHAHKVKNELSSNMMMGLYKSCGQYGGLINIFKMVQSQGSTFDEMMFSIVISSCSRLQFLDFGCQIHCSVIKTGFDGISYVNNSILELYSQCGRVSEMERVFEESETIDLFSWNMMLMGYANIEVFNKVVTIWHEMLKLGIKLNEFSYSALLHACSNEEVLMIGEQIHNIVQKMGLTFDIALMNSLLTMYSNCRQMEKAFLVFEEIYSPDSVSWNAMVSGYAQNGFPEESIGLFIMMGRNGVETNGMSYASIFASCSMLTELKLGLQFHAQAIKRAFDFNLSVSNSLITMYARCGDINGSSKIFCRTQHPDIITWNSIINSYAHHGLGKEAISVLEQMKFYNEMPNSATFVGILSSCSRAGLVSESCYHFNIMYGVYGIVPGEEHCACLVDTLCRAGKLLEAKLFIESVSINNSSLLWRTLLSFCRVNGDTALGEVAAKKIIDLEPWDSAPYVILSDLYASTGNCATKNHIRNLMENRGVKKEAGCSWISS